ncbi:MAG: glycosyltransferase [Lachnospiraceae bacterium]|nr:glycosyltransferase [Lachnospiraceae bacterium]
MLTITFVSNYINHHQIPFSEAMRARIGEGYHFIQAEPMSEERIKMGWGLDTDQLPYVHLLEREPDLCRKLIAESDIVIYGGAEREDLIVDRLQAGRIVLRYSERLYKEGQWKAISPRGLRRKYLDHTRYGKSPVYLLCAGGYVASDFHIVRAYTGKMFQWGYFPAMKTYDVTALFEGKRQAIASEGQVSLLWAGRFIDWKHPEEAIFVAEQLQKDGIDFHLTMVGGGDLEVSLKKMVSEKGLEDTVTFTGFQKPVAVREYMEKADIFLFTSDYMEGWGAVLNEAMNSGCAVVANVGIGSVPFLIKPEINGMIYRNHHGEECYQNVKKLVSDQILRHKIGEAAYQTIVTEWNASQAVDNLLQVCEGLLQGKVEFASTGPCSRALPISPRTMYKHMYNSISKEEA